jgi:hypothetical protein
MTQLVRRLQPYLVIGQIAEHPSTPQKIAGLVAFAMSLRLAKLRKKEGSLTMYF